MDLKKYQERVVAEVDGFLRALGDERAKGNRHAAADVWKARRIPGARYSERENGLGEDLPTFCMKVPTGGGKTLLATQALGSIYRFVLTDRGGAGLALWVVPSNQIYRDTVRRLSDRTDMYRIMLEHAAGRRIEVWEKQQVARLSPARLRDCLNILVLQLASTNRETKEQLKFFKDSGGAIVDHFPPENDPGAHKALKAAVPNLDMIEDDERAGRHLCATSIGNLVRLCRPPVILDEGHRATSDLARKTMEDFNASIVVELSATPTKGTNILARVSGDELLREEMIKLPLNVRTSGKKKWQDVLTEARDKRVALAKAAEKYASETGERLIRPVVLVQVQRTGKEQKGKGFIHSDDVREYLRSKLDVPESAVVVKSAEDDGLAEVDDLLADGCPVTYIITKSALQEGWDCPFAYILVSLDNTGSGRAMTQLVGRVLRQPFQKRLPDGFAALNESYAFCLHERPGEVLKQVKSALEQEGYEGEAESMVRSGGDGAAAKQAAPALWRKGIQEMYTRPFAGKIFLPRFCVKDGKEYEPLDYHRHLLSGVDVGKFKYSVLAKWSIAEMIRQHHDLLYKVTLGVDPTRESDTEVDHWESDESVLAWLAVNLPFPYLSFKQLRIVVQKAFDVLVAAELKLKGRLALAKTEVRNKLAAFVQEQIDAATERAFGELFDAGRMLFYLQCTECRFEMPESIRVERIANGHSNELLHENGDRIAKDLFDFTESNALNSLERQIALVLDKHAEVLWWYRNKVGKENFWIQGYRKGRIYPDFVAQGEHEGRALHRVLVVEAKGPQLEENKDTKYKRHVASYFERAGKQVTWQQLGEEFKDHIFRFQVIDQEGDAGSDWQDALTKLLRE